MLRSRLELNADGRYEAHLGANQSSGAVTSFAAADAIVELPPEVSRVRDGDTHDVLRIDDMIG
jgi:molybdopterin biosynthesis enzyme